MSVSVTGGGAGSAGRRWLLFSAPLLFGVALVLAYGLAEWDGKVLIVALAAGAAACAVGGLLGFLFGIPRSLTAETALAPGVAPAGPSPARYGPNTNLEQVSDWLTKILIGVGLAQASEAVEGLKDIADGLKPALGDDAFAHVFGGAEVIYFLIAGFLCAYLYTRLRLQRELEDTAVRLAALAPGSEPE